MLMVSSGTLSSVLQTTLKITKQGTTATTLWYEYDAAGNRKTQSQNGLVVRYSYNPANNELVSYISPSSTVNYGYDANDNLVSQNVTSGATTTRWTFTWDVPGNLLKVSNNAGVQGIYAYDGLGRKVESVEGSTFGYYAYIGTETLVEILTGTGGDNDYLYANGMRIAKTCIDCSPLYYHTDPLGSTRLVTDSTGTIKFSDNYQPYGADNGTPYCQQTGCSTNHKFTGKPASQTTGLQYNYQRWYDQSTGRFISMDPAGGSNQYTYGLNNPTGYVDPNGAAPIDALTGVMASQLTNHGFWQLGIYGPVNLSGSEWRWAKIRWGPGRVFSRELPNSIMKMHTVLALQDIAAGRGKANQLWKVDIHSGGYAEGWWEPSIGKVRHFEGKFLNRWVGRGMRIGGYLGKIGVPIGLVLSGVNIASAVQYDLSQGTGFDASVLAVSHEVFGWAGAIAGAQLGGEGSFLLGLACGPAAIICSPVLGLAGAMVGGYLGYTKGSEFGDWLGYQLIGNGSPIEQPSYGMPLGSGRYGI